MRLVSLKIWKCQEGQSLQLVDFENLAFIQFFKRGTAREHLTFHSRTIVNHTEPGKRQTVKLEGDVGTEIASGLFAFAFAFASTGITIDLVYGVLTA